jgi:hypothetical protein
MGLFDFLVRLVTRVPQIQQDVEIATDLSEEIRQPAPPDPWYIDTGNVDESSVDHGKL